MPNAISDVAQRNSHESQIINPEKIHSACESYEEIMNRISQMKTDDPSLLQKGELSPATIARMEASKNRRDARMRALIDPVNEQLAENGLPLLDTNTGASLSMEDILLANEKLAVMRIGQPPAFTTKSGIHVSVQNAWVYPEGMQDELRLAEPGYRVILSRDGQELDNFLLRNDVRITELENGEYSITDIPKGQEIVSGTANDDIIISLFAKKVFTGDGDDTVLALGKAEYYGENGNDTFIVGGIINKFFEHTVTGASLGSDFYGGDGDDIITSDSTLESVNMNLGDGHNSILASNIRNSNIQGGNGNNKIAVGSLYNSTMLLGNGENIFFTNMLINSQIETGLGSNKIYIGQALSGDDYHDDSDKITSSLKTNSSNHYFVGGGFKKDDTFLQEIADNFKKLQKFMPDLVHSMLLNKY